MTILPARPTRANIISGYLHGLIESNIYVIRLSERQPALNSRNSRNRHRRRGTSLCHRRIFGVLSVGKEEETKGFQEIPESGAS